MRNYKKMSVPLGIGFFDIALLRGGQSRFRIGRDCGDGPAHSRIRILNKGFHLE